MIIQGTNKPIILRTSKDISNSSFKISLWQDKEELKRWSNEDIEFKEDNIMQLPLKETETINFKCGYCVLEMKWLTEYGYVDFAKPVQLKVISRYDKEVFNDD